MTREAPAPIYLKNYSEPDYWIKSTDLTFQLDRKETRVTSKLAIVRHADAGNDCALVLDGQQLKLLQVKLDDRTLSSQDYALDERSLSIPSPGQAFELEITTEISPEANKALLGLYMSDDLFCTQCEAEGFRRITYYLDRPDVMAKFSARLEADKTLYPVLLSNGNCIDSGELENGRHWALWEDPFPKPAYLFALVAGKLGLLSDTFRTASGRDIDLRIYAEPGKEDRCDYAMDALKRSMKWDEDAFGLEYDLDIFMVVAVNAFNAGAMENKGLNIFNDKYILANPESATDADYEGIEGVVAHEYFHNWTGNRITCRDWFQLCLKEGLTVFRDQQFTSDMRSRAVKRIDDVLLLRAAQFPEDSGPLAHSVRPEKFIEIDNFFTSTVYEKGAELCRMIDTLVGRDGFRKGIDLYFERHDGTAATVEQFVDAMADANGCDLTHFLKWYSQAGTPEVSAHVDYDPASRTATLDLKQETQQTPDKSPKEPFFIPLKLGLLDSDGQDVPLNLEGEKDGAGETTRVLAFDSAKKTFRFEDIDGPVTPSLFREFSAPVKVAVDLSDQQRALLMSKDSDPFNRWEAGFQFGLSILLELTSRIFEGKDYQIPQSYLDALTSTLTDPSLDNHLKALVLTCPSEKAIAQASQVIQVEAIHKAHQQMREAICDHAGSVLNETYQQCMSNEPYSPDAKSAGRRALKNTALSLLNAGNSARSLDLAQSQFANADNMTDTMGALSVLNHKDGPERDVAFSQFYERWSKDSMVIDKWFSLQAQSSLPNTFERVQELMNDTAFSKTNPNKIHALVGAFARRNQLRFHRSDGAAYSFLADLILEIDSFNPEMAAGIMEVFANWRKYESKQKRLMHEQISRIATSTSLSPNLFEITTKTLA